MLEHFLFGWILNKAQISDCVKCNICNSVRFVSEVNTHQRPYSTQNRKKLIYAALEYTSPFYKTAYTVALGLAIRVVKFSMIYITCSPAGWTVWPGWTADARLILSVDGQQKGPTSRIKTQTHAEAYLLISESHAVLQESG